MKKLLAGICAAASVMGSYAVFAQSNVNIFYNGKYVNSEGILSNDRTLIPLRSVCETLGADVEWDDVNRIVTVKTDASEAKFTIGSGTMETPNGSIILDAVPIIINDRTFVPLRALFELFDCDVSWNDGTVNIENPEKPENSEKPENNNSDTQSPTEDSLSMQVFKLVNEQRAKYGLSALEYNKELENVAAAHSRDMAVNNYFSHTSLSGLSPFDRLKNAGISYSYAAENIAAGQKTAQAVMDSWMNSEGHRANILNANLKEIGVGVYEGGSYGIYWTQLFRTK